MIPRITCAVPICLLLFPPGVFADDVVDFAADLIGRPYVWGAEGPHSFDCSGLTQYVYERYGVELPRRAINQSETGEPVGRRLQRGDLLFFSTDSRQSLVTHVGLYEGNGAMIEASKRYGRVRRDSLDDPFWVERFMFARRVGNSIDRGDRRERRPETETGDRRRRSSDPRQATVRILERIAGELFKRPRR